MIVSDLGPSIGYIKRILFEYADTEDASEPEMVKVESEDPARNG